METVAESAIRVTVLAFGVALVVRVLQIRSPRLVHHAWTAVVVVMLLLPVFVAWGPDIAVPLLPQRAPQMLTAPAGNPEAADRLTVPPVGVPSSGNEEPPRVTRGAVAAAVYLAGVTVLLLRLGFGLLRARAIRREAILFHGRLSHPACVTPMTVGLFAPAVILPRDWVSWDEAELAAVLAHEEEHVRRRDPLVAAVALLNRAVFWFHPLAWWLQREVSSLAEQACDLVVVSGGHDADRYSSCLLRFARRATHARGRIVPMATAMPGSGLPRRLRLLTRPPARVPSAGRLGCAALACSAIVVVCSAATPAARTGAAGAVPQARSADWPVHTTEHFEIVHDGLTNEQVAGAARDAEAAFALLSGALKYDLRERVVLIVVRRDGELPVVADGARELVTRSGAPARSHVIISLESLDRRTGTIVHELTHSFAFEILPDTSRVAPFLIEGLAEHMRGAWNADDLRRTREAAATGAVPPVASLATSDRHWAHALFDFVGTQYGGEGVRHFIFALRTHETVVQAVPVAFGVTLDQFDEAFRGYVTTRFGQP